MSTRDCGLDPQDSLSCKFLSTREQNQARMGLDSLSSWRELKSDRAGYGSVLLPEDSVGQLNDSSRQIYSIVFTLILIHSITQLKIFTKIQIFCFSNKNLWCWFILNVDSGWRMLFAKIIQKNKVFSKSASQAGNDVSNWQMKLFWKLYSKIFSPKSEIFSSKSRLEKIVIRPSSPRPDDRSKLSVGLGLPLKNYPNFIKLGFSWNVSSFHHPPASHDQSASVLKADFAWYQVLIYHTPQWIQ